MIFYDGIGADPTGLHTDQEFVAIMRESVEKKKWQKRPEDDIVNWYYENAVQLKFKDWVLPDDFCFFTLDDWVDYAGAINVTPQPVS
jgi:hypothetical protein